MKFIRFLIRLPFLVVAIIPAMLVFGVAADPIGFAKWYFNEWKIK